MNKDVHAPQLRPGAVVVTVLGFFFVALTIGLSVLRLKRRQDKQRKDVIPLSTLHHDPEVGAVRDIPFVPAPVSQPVYAPAAPVVFEPAVPIAAPISEPTAVISMPPAEAPRLHPLDMSTEQLAEYLGGVVATTAQRSGTTGQQLANSDFAAVEADYGTSVARTIYRIQQRPDESQRLALLNSNDTGLFLGGQVASAIRKQGISGPQLRDVSREDLVAALGSRIASEVAF
eukprot:TRINITY_DN15238_c0_g1_i1.p1 TRINITY_DN15238_c0_g1~~TRINITY_DN15238_c0_g1_i1.p1  ORF type:complete len:238 (+),score=56.24 TRINITY_DN15238_c0_g1_i1:26-715(+)